MAEAKEATAPPVFQDEIQEVTFNSLEGLIKKRNSLVGTINAAQGDRLDLKEQLTEESDDPAIVKAREARDDAIMKLDALVAPKVEEILSNSVANLEESTNEVKEIESKLKPGITYYKKMYGEQAAEAFTPQVRSRSARMGSSATGGRRIRGFNVTVSANGEIEEFENFATAAKYLGLRDTATLQDKFFEAAGTSVLKDVPDKVQFNVEFTEVDEDENETTVQADITAYRTESE